MKKLYALLIASLIFYSSALSQIKYDDGPIITSGNFVTVGTWGRNNISFSFQNGTNDIPNNDEQNAIRQAFQLWADYGNLNFTEVTTNADIVILWGDGNHGDGFPFDGVNGVLAHAFFPPPDGGTLSGDMHFDDAEAWTLAAQAVGAQPIDLVTVAAHEIGHALGLGHSNVACALMNPFYTGSHRYLSQDDIDGIQSIYGNRTVIRNTNSACNGGTYFINNLPIGATVVWTSSNNLIATVTNNNNQGVVSWTGNQVGVVRITATITLPCGQNVMEFFDMYYGSPIIGSNNPPLIIWTGNPSTDYNNVCNSQTTYTNIPVSGATSVVWTRTAASPSNTNWSQNGNNVNFYFWNVGQTATFKITATNGCGSNSYSFGFKSISCGGGGGGCEQYKVSPNPANGTLKVIVPNIPPPCDYAIAEISKGGIKSNRTITEIKIYDNSGNLKKTQKINNVKETIVNLNGLKSGIYYIEIKDGAYSESQKIFITE